jgi:hypothetical protein
MKRHVLDQQVFIECFQIRRDCLPVHVEPHGRDVADAVSQEQVREVGVWAVAVVRREACVEHDVADLITREYLCDVFSFGEMRLWDLVR